MQKTECEPISLQQIDFHSSEFVQNPYPTYARLRQEAPVLWRDDWQIVFLSRYEDVNRLLRDRRLGRQFDHVMRREEVGLPPIPAAHAPFHRMNDNMLMDKEPPKHTRLKSLVQKAFTPRTVQRLEPRIRAIANELTQELRAQGGGDLLEAFAAPLSVTVIAELLGVPEADRARLRPWSADIVAMYELGGSTSSAVSQRAVQAAEAFSAYLQSLIAQRRREPQDDLLSALVQAEERGDRLSQDELIATCILILNAGHEATVNAVGNGMLALLRHPEQLRLLREQPRLVDGAVEEILRYDTPLPFFHRWVLEDLAYRGVQFKKGTKVGFLLGSANHDEERFPGAEMFDIQRQDNAHLGFGAGVHYCLGAPLARAELRVTLETLLFALPEMALEDMEPSYQPTFVFRGLRALPVRLL